MRRNKTVKYAELARALGRDDLIRKQRETGLFTVPQADGEAPRETPAAPEGSGPGVERKAAQRLAGETVQEGER